MASVIESKSHGGFVTLYDTINFSTSKQKYSFSKGNRFGSYKNRNTTDQFYKLPSTFGKRSSGFGIG